MTEPKTKENAACIELEFDLGDPPQKVWRAVTIPELRERWLPQEALANPDPVTVIPDQEVRYQLRDDAPPFLESTVTFVLIPNDTGGTCLRVLHELKDTAATQIASSSANSNGPPLMRAA